MNSNDIAIKVENMSKVYRIGLKENIHDSIGSAIFDFIKSPLKNYRKYRSLYKFDDINPNSDSNASDIIWALKDVFFEVKKGEVLGIIGGNGAGKSTLLKILSRITDPTGGKAEIRGRISSLLEVGTGFHQELTGRENVYLNGTILGMIKKEVDHKFDEIVDFSGIERFIDTPVKRYSSGMAVRLAFAVAAHLEPEILLVDEVLAVGDATFQKKCLCKMATVAKGGRTILFVSHNMGAVTQLCENALWLEQGQLKLTGTASDVVSSYLSWGIKTSATWTRPSTRPDDLEVQINSARVLSADDRPATIVDFDSQFKVEIAYEVIDPVRHLSIVYRIIDSMRNIVLESMDTDSTDWKGHVREPGHYISICDIPGPLLKPGRYYLSVLSFIERVKIIEHYENVFTFDISEVGYTLNAKRLGFVMPVFEWKVKRIEGMGITT